VVGVGDGDVDGVIVGLGVGLTVGFTVGFAVGVRLDDVLAVPDGLTLLEAEKVGATVTVAVAVAVAVAVTVGTGGWRSAPLGSVRGGSTTTPTRSSELKST
jgi:GTP cyclohydrolase III